MTWIINVKIIQCQHIRSKSYPKFFPGFIFWCVDTWLIDWSIYWFINIFMCLFFHLFLLLFIYSLFYICSYLLNTWTHYSLFLDWLIDWLIDWLSKFVNLFLFHSMKDTLSCTSKTCKNSVVNNGCFGVVDVAIVIRSNCRVHGQMHNCSVYFCILIHWPFVWA